MKIFGFGEYRNDYEERRWNNLICFCLLPYMPCDINLSSPLYSALDFICLIFRWLSFVILVNPAKRKWICELLQKYLWKIWCWWYIQSEQCNFLTSIRYRTNKRKSKFHIFPGVLETNSLTLSYCHLNKLLSWIRFACISNKIEIKIEWEGHCSVDMPSKLVAYRI